jgi:hypothetical protein
MDNIILITAPDKLFNQAFSLCLIEPTAELKKQLEKWLAITNCPVNIYLYEKYTNDIKWLLSVVKLADVTIIECDSIESDIQRYISFILSFPTVWHKSETDWSLINKNKFFDFPQITLKEIE